MACGPIFHEVEPINNGSAILLRSSRNCGAVWLSPCSALLLVITGFLSWLNNVYQTIDPIPFYRHDVFDAASHRLGFIVYKICLFVSWVIVYPIAGFELGHRLINPTEGKPRERCVLT